MLQPESLYDQFEGKATAEINRGCGDWPVQPHPVDLEPPCEGYHPRVVTPWDCFLNNWEGPFKTGFLGRRTRSKVVHRKNDPLILPPALWAGDVNQLVPVSIATFAEDESTIDKAEQFLRTVCRLRRPAAFEIVGVGEQPRYDLDKAKEILMAACQGDTSRSMSEACIGWHRPYTAVQFIVHRYDAKLVTGQLQAHYANSAIVAGKRLADHNTLASDELDDEGGYAATLRLTSPYCFPLRRFTRLEPDPLGVAIAALEHLGKRDWALLQILFAPARDDWPGIVRQAVVDPYKGKEFLFSDVDERLLHDKFSTPLFAVSVRLLARRRNVFDQLLGWASQFSAPPQEFTASDDDLHDDLPKSIAERTTYCPGLLLNAEELAGLIHLPAATIVSERLRAVTTRTRPAPKSTSEPGAWLLGHNTHRGVTNEAWVPPALRPRHFYTAGASGVGKSTLLLNGIVQDINAGRGVACLDPHGDLIYDILARIPQERVPHTVLFDPTDTDFPPSLNILHAKDAGERNRLVNEVVETLKRFSTTPWGSRFEYIFKAAVATVILFKKCTLWDVRRILLDGAFRQRCVSKLTDPNLLTFWHDEFVNLPKGSIDPILNRMQRFLMADNVRNILCQRETLIDFDEIINRRGIFLANLSTGLLTREVSGVFGTFIVSKLLSATFRRAAIPREQRVPFQLVVDEFQAFMGDQLSIGFEDILAEARKYGLSLAVANQYVDQLSQQVRAAIFGNVATLVSFRLGVKDARLVADEFGAYSAEELMSLEVGEAICRIGGTQTAFNLNTLPPPPQHEPDLTKVIRARCRRFYARPQQQIADQFSAAGEGRTQKEKPARRAAPAAKTAPFAEQPANESWDIWSDYVS